MTLSMFFKRPRKRGSREDLPRSESVTVTVTVQTKLDQILTMNGNVLYFASAFNYMSGLCDK